jgi:hypothetical protein
MRFGKMPGIALAVLGVILLGIQGMLYMPTGKVPTGGAASSSPQLEHKTNAVAEALGIAFLQCRIDGEALNALLGCTDLQDLQAGREGFVTRPDTSDASPSHVVAARALW